MKIRLCLSSLEIERDRFLKYKVSKLFFLSVIKIKIQLVGQVYSHRDVRARSD